MLPIRAFMRVFLLCICMSLLFLFLYITYFSSEIEKPGLLRVAIGTNDSMNDTDNWKRISVIKGTKNILLWNELWGYRFGLGKAAFLNSGCRVDNCFITNNASLMPHENFDAILVHPPTQKTPKEFTNRRADQIFVMFSNEPPDHMPSELKSFDNYFNWTMTYRSGSDFHLKYGEIIPLDTAPKTEAEATTMREQMVHFDMNPALGKTKLAIWLVSNCYARSNRQGYVKVLKNYMDVDIFSKDGQCGGEDRCPRSQNEDVCYDMIEKTYKFYFSFENSICEEYVTEKFFEMMGRNIVPVVLGGANYSAIAPPHSYISALDYTPKQLAKYLKELDSNDTLYAEYFWWKPHYTVRNLYGTSRQTFCDLCEALHSTPLKRGTVNGLEKWYMKESHCANMPIIIRN
ncbi:alpha-(1,3)-fucosyltransferase C-like [Daphnia pulex]|uniref:alpha-(1,3)-fucosyltransferase C-like n=1 Tax=Daphnia pulex TaxID=6669 RepID=UPI001EDD818C|nr:alpha-(1,3)-fucosyltransferase C-like [Daphnia pulex]